MRLLVCGGRSFNNHTFVFKTLDAFPEISVIITGAAAGVDTLALAWARENEIPFIGVPAQWKKFPGVAGPVRNVVMLTDWKPDCVLAFPGGQGTRNMMSVAKAAGIPVECAGW